LGKSPWRECRNQNEKPELIETFAARGDFEHW
jgi:hypothetical protein